MIDETPLLFWKFAVSEPKPAADGLTTWVLTSGALDRDNERVYAPGVDVSEFLANPVALAQHNARSLPIGRWENVRLIGAGWDAKLVADLRLAPAGVSEEADTVRGLIAARMLSACSIGFMALEVGQGPDACIAYLRSRLFEASIVSVPSNPEALRVAAHGGRRAQLDPESIRASVVHAVTDAVPKAIQDALVYHSGTLDFDGFQAKLARRRQAAPAREPEPVAHRDEKALDAMRAESARNSALVLAELERRE